MLGLTQEHLANGLQISYQQVQKYETGANRISAGRLFEIGRQLDVNISYFFEGLDFSAPESDLPHGGKNRVLIELVRNFTTISDPSVRAAVASLVKSLAAEATAVTEHPGQVEHV
jgi:transcriptional regulator with XRE-family HTH domain